MRAAIRMPVQTLGPTAGRTLACAMDPATIRAAAAPTAITAAGTTRAARARSERTRATGRSMGPTQATVSPAVPIPTLGPRSFACPVKSSRPKPRARRRAAGFCFRNGKTRVFCRSAGGAHAVFRPALFFRRFRPVVLAVASEFAAGLYCWNLLLNVGR